MPGSRPPGPRAPTREQACLTYRLYGLALRSPIPLPCASARARGPTVSIAVGEALTACDAAPGGGPAPADWFSYSRFADGSAYLRWSGLFDFVVSADGRRIASRRLEGASDESFRNYLLSQVLSFSLLALGKEPLHASAVAVDGGAVAFVGDCGAGKSSLAAAFVRAGYPLVTDDLLVVDRVAQGYLAHPGVSRIKLFPHVARQVLGARRAGERMNPGTAKRILRLPEQSFVSGPLPLRAIYVLPPRPGPARGGRCEIRALGARASFLAVVRATFNTIVTDRHRLARQFRFARDMVAALPIKQLSFSRRLSTLRDVRGAILADVRAVFSGLRPLARHT